MKQMPDITVRIGNIVRQADCDAIVNSANASLRAGSGVCGAIYRAAGPALEPFSSAKAPLELGQAIETPGFNLPNRWIIHCRGPKFHFDPDPAAHLGVCMRNVLRLAQSLHVRRLAVPAISMGVYAYPPEEAVPILVAAAKESAGESAGLEEIRFVVVSNGLLELFKQAIDAT